MSTVPLRSPDPASSTDPDRQPRRTSWRRAVGDLVFDVAREWRRDRCSGLSAEVAFFSALSFFPAIVAVTAALGWIDTVIGRDLAGSAEEELVGLLRDVLSDEATGTVDAIERMFRRSNGGLFTISLLVTLWTMSRGWAAVIRALDSAYDVDERRHMITLRLVAIGLAIGSVAVATGMLVFVTVAPLVFGAMGVLWAPVAVVVVIGWATTLYHFAPNHRTPWRNDLPGAALAAVSWLFASVGLRYYVVAAAGSGTNVLIGALGGAFTVLLWLYLLGAGLLLGGELNAVLARRAGVSRPRRDPLRYAGRQLRASINGWRSSSQR